MNSNLVLALALFLLLFLLLPVLPVTPAQAQDQLPLTPLTWGEHLIRLSPAPTTFPPAPPVRVLIYTYAPSQIPGIRELSPDQDDKLLIFVKDCLPGTALQIEAIIKIGENQQLTVISPNIPCIIPSYYGQGHWQSIGPHTGHFPLLQSLKAVQWRKIAEGAKPTPQSASQVVVE